MPKPSDACIELDLKSPVASLVKRSGTTVTELADARSQKSPSVHGAIRRGTAVTLRTMQAYAKAAGGQLRIFFEPTPKS